MKTSEHYDPDKLIDIIIGRMTDCGYFFAPDLSNAYHHRKFNPMNSARAGIFMKRHYREFGLKRYMTKYRIPVYTDDKNSIPKIHLKKSER